MTKNTMKLLMQTIQRMGYSGNKEQPGTRIIERVDDLEHWTIY